MANKYDKGDLVRCSVAFTDADGNAQDPTGVLFKLKDPSGNVTTHTYDEDEDLKKGGTGSYYEDVDAGEEGDFYYRFEGTGTGQCAAEEKFTVRATQFS